MIKLLRCLSQFEFSVRIVGIYHHASCPLGYRRANLSTIHLQANIPSNQDDSADQVSSLPELFSKPGCFRRLNFIPAGTFQQIRMLPPTKFHLCRDFSANQDASADQISSLPELSSKSGCFRSHKILPSVQNALSPGEYCRK